MKSFIIMPFSDKICNDIYNLSIKPICEAKGLEPLRVDELFTVNPIVEDIKTAITKSSVIIADITGLNPNVFYELGMSHILKKNQTIIITRDDFDTIPFDVSHLRIIKYQDTAKGKVEFEKRLESTLASILKDYLVIYGEEFDTVFKVLQNAHHVDSIFIFIAIENFEILSSNHNLQIVGFSGDEFVMGIGFLPEILQDVLSPFIQLEYLQKIDGKFTLTERGTYFLDFLKKKGLTVKLLDTENAIKAMGIRPR